jgi:hypothetical protein
MILIVITVAFLYFLVQAERAYRKEKMMRERVEKFRKHHNL